MPPNLLNDKLDAAPVTARPTGDAVEEQYQKYNIHKQANGALQYYIDKCEYLSAYVLAFSMLEDRIKALSVITYRDLLLKSDYEKSVNVDLSRLIGNIYLNTPKLTQILLECNQPPTDIFVDNLKTIATQRNKFIHEALWRPNSIRLVDVDIVLEAKSIVYAHQRKLARYLKTKATEGRKNV